MTSEYNEKYKTNKKWKKDIDYLATIVSDINKKMNHIIGQLRDMYSAIGIINDFKKYSKDTEYDEYDEYD